MKGYGFSLKKGPTAFHKSTSACRSLLYSLDQATKSIAIYMNSDKTEFMCYKQDGGIFIKWQTHEISWLIHIPQKQYLIYKKNVHICTGLT